jgi:hypothetical protein
MFTGKPTSLMQGILGHAGYADDKPLSVRCRPGGGGGGGAAGLAPCGGGGGDGAGRGAAMTSLTLARRRSMEAFM